MSPDTDAEEFLIRARKTWTEDWAYLNTADVRSVAVLDDPVQGLALPKEVVDKIYHLNAERLFPNSWESK
jgi:hypothetical protein